MRLDWLHSGSSGPRGRSDDRAAHGPMVIYYYCNRSEGQGRENRDFLLDGKTWSESTKLCTLSKQLTMQMNVCWVTDLIL